MDKVQEHIEKVREALGNVTPGQWNAEGFEVWRRGTGFNQTEDRHIMICDVLNLANVGLIANSPTWHKQSLDIIEQQQREIAQIRSFLQESIGNNERALSTTGDKWFAGVVFAYREILGLLSPNKEVSTDVQDAR